MADNLTLNAGSGGSLLLTYEGTFSGDTTHLQGTTVFGVSGSEGSYTFTNISDPTNGLLVNLGSNNDVTLATLPDTAAGDLAAINTAVSGTLTVGSHAVTNAGTFAVQADSVIPGTGATSLGKAEDAAHSTGDTGVLALAVRRAADTPTSGTDGDYEPLKTDANGHLKVEIFDGGDTHTVSGTVTANLSATDNAVLDTIATNTTNLNNAIVQDDAPFTPATGYLMMIGGEFDDAAPDSVDEGDAGNVRISANRSMYMQIRDAAGNERGVNVNASNAMLIQEAAALDVSAATVTVDLGANNDVQGAVAEGAAVSGNPFLIAGDDGTNVKHVAVAADGAIHIDDGGNAITVDNGGTFAVQVDAALPAGSNLVGDVGLSGARTSGGTTIFRSIDLDETEEQVKGTAGQVYWIHAMNLSGSPLYLKFYNATAATVIVGTTTPVLTFPLATQGDTNGAGFTLSIPNGIAFGTAITVACTTGIADADTGAPGANACVLNMGYA